MNALFAYGTLLFPEVLRAVIGRALPSRAATLHGFARRRLIGDIFPALVATREPDGVAGVLYIGLQAEDWRRLDVFEGDLYERRVLAVDLGGSGATGVAVAVVVDSSSVAASSATHSASTYVLREEWRHRLASEPWDPQAFAREHLDAFAARLAMKPRARSRD